MNAARHNHNIVIENLRLFLSYKYVVISRFVELFIKTLRIRSVYYTSPLVGLFNLFNECA